MGLPEILIVASLMATTASTANTLATRPKTPTPTKPEAPADLSGQADATARRMAEKRRRQAGQYGRASNIMSGSPLGQPGPANTAKKYMTGA
jgi:hypothetical protein